MKVVEMDLQSFLVPVYLKFKKEDTGKLIGSWH